MNDSLSMPAVSYKEPLETESELVSICLEALNSASWVVGRCASIWTKHYANGRIDADFGAMIGLSDSQVCQRRRTWEVFGHLRHVYPNLRWSHYRIALNWPDALRYLKWANATRSTVQAMIIERAGQQTIVTTTDIDRNSRKTAPRPSHSKCLTVPTELREEVFDRADDDSGHTPDEPAEAVVEPCNGITDDEASELAQKLRTVAKVELLMQMHPQLRQELRSSSGALYRLLVGFPADTAEERNQRKARSKTSGHYCSSTKISKQRSRLLQEVRPSIEQESKIN